MAKSMEYQKKIPNFGKQTYVPGKLSGVKISKGRNNIWNSGKIAHNLTTLATE
jgi:hypothetical protein